jgi:glycerophosphoryl diester phosphodiesterase
MVEVDVRMTGDGRLVLLHDETIDRTTDRSGGLRQLSLKQVQELTPVSQRSIPTLEEALQAVGPSLGMILELKEAGIGAEAVAIVRLAKFGGMVIYASFLFGELVRVRLADPSAAIMPLFGDSLPENPVEQARMLQASQAGFSYPTLTPQLVKICRHAGIKVFAYTVNDPVAIRLIRGLEVDGIISDFPDRI